MTGAGRWIMAAVFALCISAVGMLPAYGLDSGGIVLDSAPAGEETPEPPPPEGEPPPDQEGVDALSLQEHVAAIHSLLHILVYVLYPVTVAAVIFYMLFSFFYRTFLL